MKKRKLKSEIREISANDLQVHPEAQRELRPARVKYITENMNLDAIGVVTVVDAGRGRYLIVDGQHRWQALLALGLGDWPVHCHVYSKLTDAEAAQLFRDLNNTNRRSAWDDFSKGVIAGDEECVGISKIVEGEGLKVSDQVGDAKVCAVAALIRTYRSANGTGDEHLRSVLRVSREAWGEQADAFNGHIIDGLGKLLLRHNGELDQDALVRKLAKVPGGPAGLIGKAQARREFEGGSVATNVAGVATALYNRGRRSGALAA